eukprot:2710772-Rhodomonas_salina.1
MNLKKETEREAITSSSSVPLSELLSPRWLALLASPLSPAVVPAPIVLACSQKGWRGDGVEE